VTLFSSVSYGSDPAHRYVLFTPTEAAEFALALTELTGEARRG
jgi:hypothetical protein